MNITKRIQLKLLVLENNSRYDGYFVNHKLWQLYYVQIHCILKLAIILNILEDQYNFL